MHINRNANVDSVARFTNGQLGRLRGTTQPSAAAEFDSSQALEARLAALPGTRAAVVDYARALLKDKSYPRRETIDQIAALLAIGAEQNGEFQR